MMREVVKQSDVIELSQVGVDKFYVMANTEQVWMLCRVGQYWAWQQPCNLVESVGYCMSTSPFGCVAAGLDAGHTVLQFDTHYELFDWITKGEIQ